MSSHTAPLSQLTVPFPASSEQDSRTRERAKLEQRRKPHGDGYADQEVGEA